MDRQNITDYIFDNFSVTGERLWLDFPGYVVFRNTRNRKWFAIIMDIEKSKLGIEGSGKVDIINLKCDPLFIGSLLHKKGCLPAYHMNRKNWITVLIDGSVSPEEMVDLICMSYEIIDKKNKA